MKDYKIIELKNEILNDNNQDADALRDDLKRDKTFLFNVMSSPGSGKTSVLVRVIKELKQKYNFAVLEADIDGEVDAETIAKTGAQAVQLHTGGMCHLTAKMTRQGLNALEKKADVVFIENVGNLVCPAEYDTGAFKNITILSVPEGYDKPLKYPLMYQVCDLLVINKLDALPYFDFDVALCKANALSVNKKIQIICVSAKTGEGIDSLCRYVESQVQEWRNK